MSLFHFSCFLISFFFYSTVECSQKSLVTQVHSTNEIVFQSWSNHTVDDRVVTLKGNSSIKLKTYNVPKNIQFAIFQAHSQIHPVTLASKQELILGNHVNGTSIGLYSDTSASHSDVLTVYLINPHSFDISVLTFIMFYNKSVPIPGGCNLEFEMETAPWLRVSYNQNVVTVEHELASTPPGCIGVSRCSREFLDYEIFQYYLNQRDFSQNSFFDAIRQFRTVEGAHQSGREIRSFGFLPSTRSMFSLYPGVGRVFAVTVSYTGSNRRPSSAYVPSVSYGCDLSIENDCLSPNTTYSKIVCALSLFIGIFITFWGHRYFQIEMLLVGFVTFSTVSYVLLINHFDANATGLAAGTSLMGVLGGLFWWFVWWYLGIPALSVLPVVLMLGFLFSCIIFYLPISFEFLANDINFWSAFASCWLVLPVLLITFTRIANIISCAVIGSFAVMVPIDHYIGSSLKYIIVNVIRRVTVRGFGRAVLDPPYQDNDMILTAAWIALTVSGLAFQYLRERRRAPFSPPADIWRPNRHSAERSPLIVDSSAPNYGSNLAM